MKLRLFSSRRRQTTSARVNLPLMLLSFVFMTFILAYGSYSLWQQEKQRFQQEARFTLENYAQQSSLLGQSAYQANAMFIRMHGELLDQALNQPTMRSQLWNELQYGIFNFTGFLLLDEHGTELLRNGPELAPSEVSDVWRSIQSLPSAPNMFILRYPQDGGFYFFNRIELPSAANAYFITRRSFSTLSEIIYKGMFAGFESLLIDARDGSVIMRRNQYFQSNQQPAITEHERQRLIYSTRIAGTPLQLIAISNTNQTFVWLLTYLVAPTFILILFMFFSSLLWRRMQRHELRAQQQEIKRRIVEQRADRVLASIEDACIYTDTNNQIHYANPKALSLLQQQGIADVLGQALTAIWPDEKLLWNQPYSLDELENLPESERHVSLTVNGEPRILEQMCNPLYDHNNIRGTVWLLRDITDSVLAHRAMLESRERYKTLFEEASTGHCLIDISGLNNIPEKVHIVNVNDAMVRMLRAPNRLHLLQNYSGLLKSTRHNVREILKKAIREQVASTEFELELATFDDEIRTFWVNISLNSGVEGQVLATLLDITEKKHSEQIVREREAFWSMLMKAMPDLIFTTELNRTNQRHYITYSNRSMADLLGYDEPEEGAQHWLNFSEDDPQTLEGLLLRSRPQKKSEVCEVSGRFRHSDGSSRIIKCRESPLEIDEFGVVTRYVGLARDVTEEVEQQEKIVDSERRYRLLAENMSDVVWTADTNINFTFVSASVERVLGYKPDELLRQGIRSIFSRTDVRMLMSNIRTGIMFALNNPASARQHNIMLRKDVLATHKNGHTVLLELQASPLWNDRDELMGLIGICRDVGEERQRERELRTAAEVFDNSNEAIVITDTARNIVKFNRAFCHLTGYEGSEIYGKPSSFMLSPEHHGEEFQQSVRKTLTQEGYWQGEVSYQRADGEIRTGWAGISAMRDSDQNKPSLIVIMSDITERKVIEERIHRLAYFDLLTGLPNRSQMQERLDAMMRDAETNNRAVALLFIDLDRFKPINDSMGHPAGDQVLKEVAQRLQSCLKSRDMVCRMGGDEFTVALEGQPNSTLAAQVAKRVAERILHTLHQPYRLDQREVFVSASIGVAIYPNDGLTAVELLKNADMAMYHAKDNGRDNVQFFDESMNEHAVQQLELENDLRHALERQELELYFQPQYTSNSGAAIAAEALLRWNHPTKGMISPGTFIPIMEDTGLIVPIGQWVLENACNQFAAWQTQELPLQRIAVNVSARQFSEDNFLTQVRNAIKQSGIRPDQLELELTESILINNLEHTLTVLSQLRTMGVRTAIDDFGTGYSSLNYLKQFPVDILKIDRSFIQNLPDNADDAQITRTIISMAHNLGMGVIAEGVETSEQLAFLVSAKCEEVQGFLFSKPLPAEHCFDLLMSAEASSIE